MDKRTVTLTDIRLLAGDLIRDNRRDKVHAAFSICDIEKVNHLQEKDYPLMYAMLQRAGQEAAQK